MYKHPLLYAAVHFRSIYFHRCHDTASRLVSPSFSFGNIDEFLLQPLQHSLCRRQTQHLLRTEQAHGQGTTGDQGCFDIQ